MSASTGRSKAAQAILTWTIPFVLFAASMWVARLSIDLAPGEIEGRQSEFSTFWLDLVLFALALASCFACFLWPYSSLLTATGSIVALMYYSDIYLHASTDPLGGLVYLVSIPASVVCGACALIASIEVLRRRHRAGEVKAS